ncbi:hypothetical protein EV06_1894 [Prochlorococcus sp. MIT 0602]|nr:hypothetical protein EV06_1894 [Prochlorococcus sp. MIT 0602]KGG15736.1 hypothetical protein EV07_1701 [Prochlorococcus sp. MIT 0603]
MVFCQLRSVLFIRSSNNDFSDLLKHLEGRYETFIFYWILQVFQS